MFVGESVSLAHVGRPALLARWAREAGCDVHFACGSHYASIAKDEGLNVHPLKTIKPETFYERLNRGHFFYTCEELESYIAEERKLIRSLRPDWVVSDFRLTLPISAQLEGVKCLSLQQAHWSPRHACPMAAPRISPFTFLPSSLAENLFAWLRPLAFRLFARPLNKVRLRHGLKTLKDLREHYTAGTACAYLDLPALNPVNLLPENHFYLGPLHWSPVRQDVAIPEEIDRLGRSRPLAYVSLGSSGDERVWPMVVQALVDEGFDVVASGVSAQRQSQWLAANVEWRDRVALRTLLNPAEILKRAALTVCHGGHGTTYQSLRAGVPMLSLPANPDQGLMAAAMEAQGAGRFLFAHRITLKRLRGILKMMVNDTSYKIASRGLAQDIHAHDTRGAWISFLTRCGVQRSAFRTSDLG